MLFGSRQNLAKLQYFCIQLHGKVLARVAKFNYLGVVLDETLSWRDHVEYMSSKVCSRLGLLTRIRSCLRMQASKKVYTSVWAYARMWKGDGDQLLLDQSWRGFSVVEGNSTNTCIHASPSLFLKHREPQPLPIIPIGIFAYYFAFLRFWETTFTWLCWCGPGWNLSEGCICCKELQLLQNYAARIILRRKTSKDTLRV